MFVASVYYYLFNDVVPHQFLGRFMAAFRVVSQLSGSAFYFFIFPFSETHFTEIFVGASILYGTVFFLMCRFVKEGEYPPPPQMTSPSKSAVLAGIKTFFVESFSNRFYWLFYLWTSAAAAAGEVALRQLPARGLTLKRSWRSVAMARSTTTNFQHHWLWPSFTSRRC
jgi:hypothetical protein